MISIDWTQKMATDTLEGFGNIACAYHVCHHLAGQFMSSVIRARMFIVLASSDP